MLDFLLKKKNMKSKGRLFAEKMKEKRWEEKNKTQKLSLDQRWDSRDLLFPLGFSLVSLSQSVQLDYFYLHVSRE